MWDPGGLFVLSPMKTALWQRLQLLALQHGWYRDMNAELLALQHGICSAKKGRNRRAGGWCKWLLSLNVANFNNITALDSGIVRQS